MKDPYLIHPLQSIMVGILFALLISFPISFLLGMLFGNFVSWTIYYPAALLAASGIALFGGVQINVAYRGVLLFLGKRVRGDSENRGGIFFDEGLHWIPPFVCGIEEVSVKEYSTDVAETKYVSSNMVEMKTDASIQWHTIDPFKVLSLGTGDKTGEDVIEDGLKLLVQNFLRSDGKKYTDKELMGHTEDQNKLDIPKRIMKMLTAKTGEGDDEGEIEDRWGIRILNVLVSNVLPVDPKILDAYEKQRIETEERAAETTESDFFIQRTNKIKKDTGLSVELAAAFFSTERGKTSPYQRIEVSGNGRAIVMTGGGQSPTPKGGD